MSLLHAGKLASGGWLVSDSMLKLKRGIGARDQQGLKGQQKCCINAAYELQAVMEGVVVKATRLERVCASVVLQPEECPSPEDH